MNKKGILTIALTVLSVLVSIGIYALAKGTSTKSESQVPKAGTVSQTNEGNKITEVNTTWGDFLDSYNKENPDEYYNPRNDISKDYKVRVVKIEYPNGLESKAGFYSYALLTCVYDANTGELLTSVGAFKNKK